jgi:hypothetical protein
MARSFCFSPVKARPRFLRGSAQAEEGKDGEDDDDETYQVDDGVHFIALLEAWRCDSN